MVGLVCFALMRIISAMYSLVYCSIELNLLSLKFLILLFVILRLSLSDRRKG